MDEQRKGRQTPTRSFVLPYEETEGAGAVDLYNSTGRSAQEWQKLILADILATNDDGLWTHSKYGYSLPRRNGKNEVIAMRELYGLMKGEHILHTAHRTTTTHSAWERLMDLTELAGLEIVSSYRAYGKEHITVNGDGRVEFRTRTSKGGLGEGFDLLIIDEAQEYQDDQESTLKYTVTDSKNPQTILTGMSYPVNFAKYIVDTMNGFFMGIPVKSTCDNGDVASYLDFLSQYNDQDNNNSELSKICSIYGHGYEMYFVDEEGNIGITYLSPMDAFIIYDESIIERPLYFVRRYTDNNNVEWGSWSDGEVVQHFRNDGQIRWMDEPHIHGFDGVPASEYLENEERMGIFESTLPLIDAYNKAISEKANDVDYFADAYLKVLGTDVQAEQLKHLRENRIINFSGTGSEGLEVDFLQKPDSDTTQEHLLDRLERLFFQISMVANLSDQDFGSNSSGVSLQYKLQGMYNLAKTKEMKFRSGMNRRYMLIFSNPVSGMNPDAWVGITYRFTVNLPANLSDEANTAAKLEGIVSKETQLKVLSCVDDVYKEMERIEQEDEKLKSDAVMDGYFGGDES